MAEGGQSSGFAIAVSAKKKKNQKRNGFFMFMKERRPEIEASGVKITRGWVQVSEIVNEEWQAMSAEEKMEYQEKAKMYNERMGNPAPQMQPGSHDVPK